jgi:hypothetical protein
MPNTYKAFKMSSSLIAYTWKCYALGAEMKNNPNKVDKPTGSYAKSIKERMLSPFNYFIYSDSHYAEYIENGTEPYDMKKTHTIGSRSRMSKDGVPYLIVPFRHGAPGTKSYPAMPEQVYNAIRTGIKEGQIQLSHVVKGRKVEKNYKGELIPRKSYEYGSRITGTGVKNLEGMLAFDVSTPASVRTEYVTFRVISQNSPGHKWIHPGSTGKHITRSVGENTKEIIEDMIADGLRKDLGLSK